MRYLDIPQIPKAPVRLAVVDGRLPSDAEDAIKPFGMRSIKTSPHPGVYEAIAFHPDIMLHPIGGKGIVYAPGTPAELLSQLQVEGFSLIMGEKCLSGEYPHDIAYNVARVGSLAFHHTSYTDPVLKRELGKAGVELIHVNQGYTKCSVSIVDEKSIITADKGIANIAEKRGLDVLLIEPDRNIRLRGLDHGFIGGSSGLLDKGVWAVAGSFEKLASADRIKAFMDKKGVEIISLGGGQVVDIGTIMPILTE